MKTVEQIVQEILRQVKGRSKEDQWTYIKDIQKRLSTELVKIRLSKKDFNNSKTNYFKPTPEKNLSVNDKILEMLK